MSKLGTKTEHEKAEDEAERLVRPSPSNKPPRRDKERGRVEVADPDTSSKDKDLSMNFKQIGGRVARMYMSIDFNTEKELESYLKDHPKADVSLHRVVDPKEDSKPEGGERPKKVRKKQVEKKISPESPSATPSKSDAEMDAELEAEMSGGASQLPKPGKPKTPKLDPKVPSQRKELVEQLKAELSEASYDDLYEKAMQEERTPEAEAALEALLARKDAFPSNNLVPANYKGGKLSDSSRQELTEHARNWDIFDYDANLYNIVELREQAKLEGNERASEYYTQVISTYEEVKGDLRGKQSLAEVDSISAILPTDLKGLSETQVEQRINREMAEYYQAGLYSSLGQVNKAREEMAKLIEETEEGSPERAYYEAVESTLDDLEERKGFDETMSSGALLSRMQEGHPELDPASVDFTDPKAVDGFMDRIRGLDDKALVALVKDDPEYAFWLGVDGTTNPSEAVLDTSQRNKLYDQMSRHFTLKGYYEQLRLSPDTGGHAPAFDPVQVKKYMQRRESERDLSREITIPSGFTEFMANLLESLMSTSKRQAMINGIAKALNTRTAQYRGMPGPVPASEMPAQPAWRLPSGALSLGYADYEAIIGEAVRWMKSSSLADVRTMPSVALETVCEMALDYGILTADDYKYAGMIDAPTYAKLHSILCKIFA
jgi:hypothetical protein